MPQLQGTSQANFVCQYDNAHAQRARNFDAFSGKSGGTAFAMASSFPEYEPHMDFLVKITCRVNHLACQSSNVPDFQKALVDALADIPISILRALADGMPRRVEALPAARGGHIRYKTFSVIRTVMLILSMKVCTS